jgi:hypothetical protein
LGHGPIGPKRTQKDPKGPANDPKGPVLDWERNGLIGPIKKWPAVGGCCGEAQKIDPHGLLRPFLRHFWPIKIG